MLVIQRDWINGGIKPMHAKAILVVHWSENILKPGIKKFLDLISRDHRILISLLKAGYELVGLVSWGYGCARTYGVFTQVGTFGNWLQQSKAKLDRCDSHKDCIGLSVIQY